MHGGIDGYSRFLVFLRLSETNTKEVVAGYFLQACRTYGVPSRIRVDKGGENNLICEIMEGLRGPHRGSAIRGRSVHNQRIERSWRDLWNGVSNLYSDVFNFLEAQHLLDVDDEVDLWILHFVYKPRIERDLQRYVTQWNRHPLRTERHRSPLQLFVHRTLTLNTTNIVSLDDVVDAQAENVLQDQWPAGEDGDLQVPTIDCALTDEQVAELQETFDPLDNSEDEMGLAIYRAVRTYVADNM